MTSAPIQPAEALTTFLRCLRRARVVHPRHWEPRKDLLKVATDAIEEWAHRRCRVGHHPLQVLSPELHAAADIVALESLGNGCEDPRQCGQRAFLESRHCPSLKAISAFAIEGAYGGGNVGALGPWAMALAAAHGTEVAESFVGVIQLAVGAIGGWAPAYAEQLIEGWDTGEYDDDEEGVLTVANFEKGVPAIARSCGYKRAHLAMLSRLRGMEGRLGQATLDLADALRREGPLKPPKHAGREWMMNHAHEFSCYPHPAAIVVWSNEEVEDGGFDPVISAFDMEMEMIYNSESHEYSWLHAFDPTREGDGPGTIRYALAALGRVLRLYRTLDAVLQLLDRAPDLEARVRVRV